MIHLPIDKLVLDNRLDAKAETSPATGVPQAVLAIVAVEEAWVIERAEAEEIGSGAVISRAPEAETGMLLEEDPEDPRDTTDRVLAPVVVAAPQAWAPEVVEAAAGVAVPVAGVDDVDSGPGQAKEVMRSTRMKSTSAKGYIARVLGVAGLLACATLYASELSVAQSAEKKDPASSVVLGEYGKGFATPKEAADALVDAAEKFDVPALLQIFGPGGEDIVLSGEFSQDKKHATDFATEAREKMSISVDPKSKNRAFLLVGDEDWPFPVPIVKRSEKWFFDAKAGQQELLYRRIGANELDAIQICHGYVETQYDYAFQKREGYDVNQYAQLIVSTPGKQDGLAWQNPDGTWGGPIGEKIALAIEQGYSSGQSYHGYFFKILKGQGPSAPLGTMDYVVKGAMIGGFALVAAPAEYGISGVKTFIVSDDGVVYEKDLGPKTLDAFKAMERFDPDKSWAPVPEDRS